MKKAIVTLAIGNRFLFNFNKYCHGLWKKYAQKNNLDLVVITEPLDESERAKLRSPSWQKCLILSHDEVKKYDQVAWIDSDVLINPASFSIFNGVPKELIGAVDEFSSPTKEEYQIGLERLYEYWSRSGIHYIENISASAYHNNFGLEGDFDSVVQAGVLVLSPEHHNELLEHVYYHYEDKGEAHWNYEMRPLSFEILKKDIVHWLNPKFNISWSIIKHLYYPFLITPNSFTSKAKTRIIRNSRFIFKDYLKTKCATTAFLNNYFLHFAGCAEEMQYVNQKVSSTFEM